MDTIIQPLVKIWPQCPPTIQASKFSTITAADIKTAKDFPEIVNPPTTGAGRSRPSATEVGRIIFMRHGHLQDVLMLEILSDVYGANSFLRKYVFGEISHADCSYNIEKWDLACQQIRMEMPTVDVDPVRHAECTGKIERLEQAMETLRKKVKDVYRRECETHNGLAAKAKRKNTKDRATRFAEFYRAKMEDKNLLQPPQRTFSTVEEVIAAKPVPLLCRDKDAYKDFSTLKMNDIDVFASVFGIVGSVADIQSIKDDTQLSRLWRWRLWKTCTIIHDKVYRVEVIKMQLKQILPFPSSVKVDEAGVSSAICRLDAKVKDSEFGSWKDVPTLTVSGRQPEKVSENEDDGNE
ncbi:hypothetical protein EK21DRAFT_85571 [Setomelanomma holmii]|uniref:Uncharacterized protein n=1 Tax=Setomelanomma holmii TaxID=210430 RepID=A0A9P4HHH6_9PLEO|nr:hypothetical protein EK21DRAFT_85571 [Setomelanomma holmii]